MNRASLLILLAYVCFSLALASNRIKTGCDGKTLFEVHEETRKFDSAKSFCRNRGPRYNLARVSNDRERDLVNELRFGTNSAWIGAEDRGRFLRQVTTVNETDELTFRKFKWVDGNGDTSYINGFPFKSPWNFGEPKFGDCVRLRFTNRFFASSCSKSRMFACRQDDSPECGGGPPTEPPTDPPSTTLPPNSPPTPNPPTAPTQDPATAPTQDPATAPTQDPATSPTQDPATGPAPTPNPISTGNPSPGTSPTTGPPSGTPTTGPPSTSGSEDDGLSGIIEPFLFFGAGLLALIAILLIVLIFTVLQKNKQLNTQKREIMESPMGNGMMTNKYPANSMEAMSRAMASANPDMETASGVYSPSGSAAAFASGTGSFGGGSGSKGSFGGGSGSKGSFGGGSGSKGSFGGGSGSRGMMSGGASGSKGMMSGGSGAGSAGLSQGFSAGGKSAASGGFSGAASGSAGFSAAASGSGSKGGGVSSAL